MSVFCCEPNKELNDARFESVNSKKTSTKSLKEYLQLAVSLLGSRGGGGKSKKLTLSRVWEIYTLNFTTTVRTKDLLFCYTCALVTVLYIVPYT